MRQVITLFAGALSLAPLISAAKAEWPPIQPIDRTYVVDFSAAPIEIILPILGGDGRQLYLFTCRGGDDAQMDALSDRSHITYVGPFACRLNDGETESEDTLLSEDDVAAWHSRGQFHASELLGPCASYP